MCYSKIFVTSKNITFLKFGQDVKFLENFKENLSKLISEHASNIS